MGKVSLNLKCAIIIPSLIDKDYENETQVFVQTMDIRIIQLGEYIAQ